MFTIYAGMAKNSIKKVHFGMSIVVSWQFLLRMADVVIVVNLPRFCGMCIGC